MCHQQFHQQRLGAPSHAGHVMAGAHGLDYIGRGIGVHHLCIPRIRQLAAQQAVPAPRVKHPDVAGRPVPAAGESEHWTLAACDNSSSAKESDSQAFVQVNASVTTQGHDALPGNHMAARS